MCVDRMSDRLEAEEVLRFWAEQQKHIAALRLADELITRLGLNDASAPRPLGKRIVDKLSRQQGGLGEVPGLWQFDPLTGKFVFAA